MRPAEYSRRRLSIAGVLLALAPAARAVPPGEVPNLLFCAGSESCLSWSATAGATRYAVYRGDAASLSRLLTADADSCLVGYFDAPTTGPLLLDPPLPSDGLQWYLVAARNVDGEGTLGDATAGPRQLGSTGACCGQPVFATSFDGANGSPWPAPWTSLANSVGSSGLAANRGAWRPRLSSVGYSLARFGAPLSISADPAASGERNVEATFAIEFSNVPSQGIGFYLRQNGGYCLADNTAACGTGISGQGYAVFFHGSFFSPAGLDLWFETGGDEQIITPTPTAFPFANGQRYRVRYRVVEVSATSTFLGAKVWSEGSPEPAAWTVQTVHTNATLQNAYGGVGVDSYIANSGSCAFTSPSDAFLDDVEVRRICNPFLGAGALTPVSTAFSFPEGPIWRSDRLLFTDTQADTIYQLIPPSAVSVWKTPSGRANGLATDRNGDLLACEQTAHRLSRTNAAGVTTTIVDNLGGIRLNAPNDVTVRADGSIYFTDPDYQAVGTPLLPKNDVFRLSPSGTLSELFIGNDTTDQPNGVSLSPDEKTLYVSNSPQGRVDAFTLVADGSATGSRVFATGMTTPDGMCVDAAGNLFVATWDGTAANRLRAFSPDGAYWGAISIPQTATNCGFGGSDFRTLYVTAGTGLYRMSVPIPGVPGKP